MNRWAPFVWITALRFLKEGRMQTIFIVTAVGIGVAVIVFMSAMLSSLQANFLKRVLTSQPHIQLIPPDEVARPLRRSAEGQMIAANVQRPVQRIRSIDQWQKIKAQLSNRRAPPTLIRSWSARRYATPRRTRVSYRMHPPTGAWFARRDRTCSMGEQSRYGACA
jgi:ABC-type lipoprotein release transport system permease subunit